MTVESPCKNLRGFISKKLNSNLAILELKYGYITLVKILFLDFGNFVTKI